MREQDDEEVQADALSPLLLEAPPTTLSSHSQAELDFRAKASITILGGVSFCFVVSNP